MSQPIALRAKWHSGMGWMAALSSVSFASSYKWFLVLVLLLPDAVERVVPGGQKSTYWGAVFAVGAIWAVVGPAIFGDLSDRVGDRKWFILGGSILTGAAALGLYHASTLFLLALGYLFLQVTDDLAMGPYSALIPELFKPKERGKASGFMSMAMSLGQVGAVLMALVFAARALPLYLSIGLLNIVACVIVISLLRGHRVEQRSKSAKRKGWLSAWRDYDFRQVWLTRFFATLAFYFIIPYADFFIQDMVPQRVLFGFKLSSPEQATSVLALTIAVATAIGAIISGPLADWKGRKPIAYIGAWLMCGGFLAMVFLPSFTWLWVLAVFVGIGQGAFQAATWAMAADVLPDPAGLGRDMGLWQASISSVQIVSGAAGGLVTFGNDLRLGLGYQTLFVLAAVSMAAGVFFTRRVAAVK